LKFLHSKATELINSKKWNRLEDKNLNDLVFVHYNLRNKYVLSINPMNMFINHVIFVGILATQKSDFDPISFDHLNLLQYIG